MKSYKALCNKYNIAQPTNELSQLVKNEWNDLLKAVAFSVTPKETHNEKTGGVFGNFENIKVGAFSELEYTPKTPLFSIAKNRVKEMSKKKVFYVPAPYSKRKSKKCVSCDSDITRQHPKSIYCSPSLVGKKEAQRCRDIQRNKVVTYQRRFKTATKRGYYVVIAYAGEAVTLHPNEITDISKQTWATVTDVQVLRG